jgi:hypothetical protein
MITGTGWPLRAVGMNSHCLLDAGVDRDDSLDAS